MDEINIVEYNREDKNSCIDLLKKTFVDTSDEITFNWRFESSLRPTPLIVCAKHRDKVISFNSWIPWEFLYNGKKFVGYQSGESATDPQYRGKGIWGKTLSYADKIALDRNIDFLFGFPSKMSYSAFHKAGYYPICNFYFHNRIINPFKKRMDKKTDYQYDDFNHQIIMERNKITPIFDSGYFRWRYLDNPKNYDVIKYDENNNQAIFILTKGKRYNPKHKVNINIIKLLDCQFSCYHDKFINNAIEYLEKIYSRKAFLITTFFNENTDKGRAIIKHFNIKDKSRFEPFSIKPLNKNIEYSFLFNYNNWDILPHVVDEY